jgi:hypothetical protein
MTTNLRLLNPDFDYLFFDNADVEKFIDQEFPRRRRVFDAFRYPIQRYDFFRYLAIFRLGGFYFDLDVLLASDLSGLLSAGCVFPFEGLTYSSLLRDHGMDWEIGNYAFGCSPGHPFLEAVIENCVRGQRDPDWVKPMMRGVPLLSRAEYHVLYTTGPGLVSRTLAESPSLASEITVLFPDDVCDALNWNTFGDIGVHLTEGTWRPTGRPVQRRLAQRLEAWKLKRVIRKGKRLGKTRRVVGSPGEHVVTTVNQSREKSV